MSLCSVSPYVSHSVFLCNVSHSALPYSMKLLDYTMNDFQPASLTDLLKMPLSGVLYVGILLYNKHMQLELDKPFMLLTRCQIV